MRFQKLRRGDKVGIVATGFVPDKKKVLGGISYIQSMGFQVVLGPSLFKRSGYFAASEEERASDLNRMIENSRIRAIFFARGGFGTSKIIDSFHFEALRKDPKPLVGYSDLTALFLAVNKRLKIPVFYGPVVAELGTRHAFDPHSLWALLNGESIRINMVGKKWCLSEGEAKGDIDGGCLTLITTLIGTDYEPDFQNKILFFEDVGEELYRIERLLNHLKMAGKLRKLKGVIVGKLMKCPPAINAPGKRSVKSIIMEYLGHRKIPIIHHFPSGHCRKKITLPLGGKVHIHTKKNFIEFCAR